MFKRLSLVSDQRHIAYGDVLFYLLVKSVALFSSLILVFILLSLFFGALPAIQEFGLLFFWNNEWDPVKEKFGGFSMIIGTIVTSAIALIIATPISLGIAIFLTELAPTWLRKPLSTAIELLAAIPSIVYGMWGLLVFSPFLVSHVQKPLQEWFGEVPHLNSLFSGPLIGLGFLSAGIILAIMIIPFIVAIMRDVFELTPPLLKESAYGLGATTWEVVCYIVLPYTKAGVTGGIILGLGRALGETMAVTFVIGNISKMSSFSLFQPANSITSTLANEFAEAAPGLHQSALFYLGLILFTITFIVLVVSRLLLLHLSKRNGA